MHFCIAAREKLSYSSIGMKGRIYIYVIAQHLAGSRHSVNIHSLSTHMLLLIITLIFIFSLSSQNILTVLIFQNVSLHHLHIYSEYFIWPITNPSKFRMSYITWDNRKMKKYCTSNNFSIWKFELFPPKVVFRSYPLNLWIWPYMEKIFVVVIRWKISR